MFRVLIGLGSNRGERWRYLRKAAHFLTRILHHVRFSPLYETPPWGYTRQPAFLNAVAVGETHLTPHVLLSVLRAFERRYRRPGFRWGPRELDLDLLLVDQQVVHHPDLSLPHPWLHRRGFVLLPAGDVAPHWIHPLLHRSIDHLRQEWIRNHPGELAGYRKIPASLL